ncbi:helix-hairpin-helix domain-containing protein [candidate division KSB1 bacterium]|nr:helix-hairpin-helix domain-containing protein [candidate division KSB1 bacterium]
MVLFLRIMAICIFAVRFCTCQPIESLVDEDTEQPGLSIIAEQIENFEQNPVNILTASMEQLSQIPGITTSCAREILNYRQSGKMFLKEHLALVPCVHAELYRSIESYITVTPKPRPRLQLTGRQRGIFIPGKTRQITDFKTYFRLKCHIGDNLFFGGLVEKDLQERQFSNLLLYNCQIRLPFKNTYLILGHFSINWGHGLFHWGGFRSSSLFSMNAAGQNSGTIKPFLSVGENSSLYGFCLSTQFRQCAVQAFYSKRFLDASLMADSVRALKSSGLHSSENELESQDALSENLYGMTVCRHFLNCSSVGLAYQSMLYSSPFARGADVDKAFAFTGCKNNITSCTFRTIFELLQYWGEVALSQTGGTAAVTGFQMGMNDFNFYASVRAYQKFQNLHANSYGENNNAQNEIGFLMSWSSRLNKRTRINFALDVFRHPWAKYRAPMPTAGWTCCSSIENRMGKTTWQCRIKIKSSELGENYPDGYGNAIKQIVSQLKTAFRIQWDYHTNKLRLRSRAEWIWIQWQDCFCEHRMPSGVGNVLYNEIKKTVTSRIFVQARYCLFYAPEYEGRFFLYESDVPGVVNLEMLYGRGTRWYLVLGYKSKSFSLHTKISSTRYLRHLKLGQPVVEHDSLMSCQLDWCL